MVEQQKQRKVRAILAGGLVLGVGAVLTMAAWNGSEFATGNFKTGAFALEGKNPLDPNFSSHPSADSAAQLSFSVETTNMSPGDKVTAPFAVRLTAATTFDGSAVINTAVATSVAGLTQRVYTSATATCSGTAVQEIVGSQSLATAAGATGFELTSHGPGTPGDTVNLCFEITAGSTLDQSGSSTAVWEIAGTQKTAP